MTLKSLADLPVSSTAPSLSPPTRIASAHHFLDVDVRHAADAFAAQNAEPGAREEERFGFVRVEAQARHVDGALASQREQRRLAPTELRHEPWPDADQTTYAQGEGLLPRAPS